MSPLLILSSLLILSISSESSLQREREREREKKKIANQGESKASKYKRWQRSHDEIGDESWKEENISFLSSKSLVM